MNIYKTFFIGLSVLFLSACATEQIKVETILDNETKTWGGQDLPKYPENTPRLTMLKFTVPPAEKLPKHYHSVINVAYMIKGELTVRDEDGNTVTIKAGEPLVELVGKVHYGENNGSEDAELVVLYLNDETEIPITTKVEASK